MSERSRHALMSEQAMDKGTLPEASAEASSEARRSELQALSEEIVDLFYTQIFSPGVISTPSDVCAAFSEMLLRHWDLCCIIIYLRNGDGRLSLSAIHTHEHFDGERAQAVGAMMAEAVELEGRELQVWLDDRAAQSADSSDPYGQALKAAGLYAGVAMPIYARGALVGALIAVTSFPERLRAALNGIRFIAAPIVIAVGNARRATALREQHDRIEHLVEELQQRGHELEEANRELQRVARYRSLFLARMSHELRTPLTSILGFTEIMLDHEDLSPSQRRYCEKIQSSGVQLQASLNQLVDLSRLEAGQTELFLHEFSLRQALRESCAAVTRLAQKQGVKIDCDFGQGVGTIVSDEGKLRQVLYNFIAHAIGRSPEGSHIKIYTESLPEDGYRISVADTGETLQDMMRVFEPIDIDAPTEQATSMNELGLVIARRLIDIIGGSVRLESAEPHGLKVLIDLPQRPAQG